MDFYDAMKNGTSEEELIKAFKEAINAAKKKLETEKRAKENIDRIRTSAAMGLSSYLNALYPDTKVTVDDINEILLNSEKLSDSMNSFCTRLTQITKDGKTHTKFTTNCDDEILKSFFDGLKSSSWLL